MVRPYFPRLATRDLNQELTITCNREKRDSNASLSFRYDVHACRLLTADGQNFGDLKSLRKAENVSFYHTWTTFPFRLLLITFYRKISRLLRFRFTHKGYFANTIFISSCPNLKKCQLTFAVNRKTNSNSLYYSEKERKAKDFAYG